MSAENIGLPAGVATPKAPAGVDQAEKRLVLEKRNGRWQVVEFTTQTTNLTLLDVPRIQRVVRVAQKTQRRELIVSQGVSDGR